MVNNLRRTVWLFWALLMMVSCTPLSPTRLTAPSETALPTATQQTPEHNIPDALPLTAEAQELPAGPGWQRLLPESLVYQGAFRLPDGPVEHDWAWGGSALTWYPQGDPHGAVDGYPGSLFGTGHEWYQDVSEISIPPPVLSPQKDLSDLNIATTLQPFQPIWGDLFPDLEMPRVGLAYLPAQGEQQHGKLYFARAQHMGQDETLATHGWAGLDLSQPEVAGTWRVGEYPNFVTGDYLFDIPADWAALYLGGKSLATGRYRDGGQGAQGPSILAIAPWQSGNSPVAGTQLEAQVLLLYGSVTEPDKPTLRQYHHSDEWSGAAWLTAGQQAAVVFAGTKGLGDCWYGCQDGTVWPDQPPFPPECPERGWWSTEFAAQLLFYDPADLA
ncbi:MAG: hypothetical protein JW862_18180, partial [Anaerolineales bacterium]|nr:hypothetical protein [Anaerolineales bacterium]